jgi:hypothetical protein
LHGARDWEKGLTQAERSHNCSEDISDLTYHTFGLSFRAYNRCPVGSLLVSVLQHGVPHTAISSLKDLLFCPPPRFDGRLDWSGNSEML